MILNAVDGKPLPVYGDGLYVRDWIHVEDHCEAIDAVLLRGARRRGLQRRRRERAAQPGRRARDPAPHRPRRIADPPRRRPPGARPPLRHERPQDPRGARLDAAPRLRAGAGRHRRPGTCRTSPGASACAAAPTATTTNGSTARACAREASERMTTTTNGAELRGVILAGGTGSRLFPLTKVTNKHLLPVGHEPMIFHPVRKLVEAGIREILIVTGTEHMGDVVGLLGSGNDFGCEFTYRVQDQAGGIAQALGLARRFGRGGRLAVILGDNIFSGSIAGFAESFRRQKSGAKILVKEVHDPGRYGVAVTEGGRVVAHRREAEGSAEQPGGDRHLLLRRAGLRGDRRPQAVGARRARDHRRQQRVHRARRPDVRHAARAGGPTPARSSRSSSPTSWRRARSRAGQVAAPPPRSARAVVGRDRRQRRVRPGRASTGSGPRAPQSTPSAGIVPEDAELVAVVVVLVDEVGHERVLERVEPVRDPLGDVEADRVPLRPSPSTCDAPSVGDVDAEVVEHRAHEPDGTAQRSACLRW